MIGVRDLPTVDAVLNGSAAVLLVWGHAQMKRGRMERHKRIMLTAFGVSVVFLICYLTYHAQVGDVRFQKTGPIRPVYFTILITHIILAAAVPVLVVITLWRAFKGQFLRHRAIARWTYPIWMYVSVTGVVVYLMLYHL